MYSVDENEAQHDDAINERQTVKPEGGIWLVMKGVGLSPSYVFMRCLRHLIIIAFRDPKNLQEKV